MILQLGPIGAIYLICSSSSSLPLGRALEASSDLAAGTVLAASNRVIMNK